MELHTRRSFLRTSAAAVAAATLAPWEWLQGAEIAPVQRGRTLVVIFLRGGMDGLNFLVPYGDPAYAALRPSIALAAPGRPDGALDLNGFFGLHPKAAALLPLFREGTAAALQAVGYDGNTRSHFEEQDTWETGQTGSTVRADGWLNRHLLTSTGHGPLRAVALGDSLPRILRGEAPALAVHGLADATDGRARAQRAAAALAQAYCTPLPAAPIPPNVARGALARSAQTSLEGEALLRRVTAEAYRPAAEYPKTELARQLQDAARLIKAGLGVEVIELDFGGWDTHQKQGGAEGAYARLVQTLSEGVAAFTRDLGDRMNDVLVLTLSDFGRTAAENGTGGTDHGWANCLLAIGAGLRRANAGPRIVGTFPGLAREQLHQKRDLQHTTDFRDVLGEVVAGHLANPNLARVLPGHECKPVGLLVA